MSMTCKREYSNEEYEDILSKQGEKSKKYVQYILVLYILYILVLYILVLYILVLCKNMYSCTIYSTRMRSIRGLLKDGRCN